MDCGLSFSRLRNLHLGHCSHSNQLGVVNILLLMPVNFWGDYRRIGRLKVKSYAKVEGVLIGVITQSLRGTSTKLRYSANQPFDDLVDRLSRSTNETSVNDHSIRQTHSPMKMPVTSLTSNGSLVTSSVQ